MKKKSCCKNVVPRSVALTQLWNFLEIPIYVLKNIHNYWDSDSDKPKNQI